MLLGRIILGLIVVVIGALITIKSEWILQNFGPIPSADRIFSTEGGSRLAYKLIGIFAAIVGFLIMTNMIEVVLLGIFGRLFTGFAG